MAPKVKPEKNVVQPPSTLDETEQEFASIEEEMLDTFAPKFVKMIKRLVYEVATVGLSEEEACVIVNYDYAKLTELKKKHNIVRRLFDMKNLEYKRGLMKTLSNKARNGDEKLSQWLLESRYPNEFNRRKGGGGGGEGGGDDLLGQAIEFIQKTTATDGLITETAGRSFLVKGGGNKGVVPNLHETLGGRAKEIVASINKEKGNE